MQSQAYNAILNWKQATFNTFKLYIYMYVEGILMTLVTLGPPTHKHKALTMLKYSEVMDTNT